MLKWVNSNGKGKENGKRKGKKKKVLVIAIVGAIVISMAGIAYAWFISKNDSSTTYSLDGSVNGTGVGIIEPSNIEASFFPSETINHTVGFQNTASYDQFIRAKITCEWIDESVMVEGEEVKVNNDLLILNFNYGELQGAKWVKDGEYYYYIDKVSSEKAASTLEENNDLSKTTNLLNSITLSEEITNGYMGKNYKLNVDVESVQVQGGGHKAWKITNGELVKKFNELSGVKVES